MGSTRRLGRGPSISLVLLAMAGCTRGPQEPPDPGLPNIVLISLDTLRADAVGPQTTPPLHPFGRRRAPFSLSYAQAPSTVPTHASMFSGLPPHVHQTYRYDRRLESDVSTMAEILFDAGYATTAIFSSYRFRPGTGLDQGFAQRVPLWNLNKNARSAAVNDAVKQAAAETTDRPFFVFAHYYDAHAPYAPPGEAPPPPAGAPGPDEIVAFIEASADTPIPLPILHYLQERYAASVSYLDDNLSPVLSGLAPANGRPVLWVITGDHGEEFKEHGYLGHSTWLHEELLRVPLIINWTGRVPAGTQIDAPVQTIDILPTVLDLIDRPLPPGLPGRSLAGLLSGGAPPPEPVLFLQQNPRNWSVTAAANGARFRLVKQRGQRRLALFNLTVDPRADRDVADERPEVRRALLELARSAGVTDRKLREEGTRDVSADEIERLSAMGYVDEVTEQ